MSPRIATALEVLGVTIIVAAITSFAFVAVPIGVAGIIAGLYCVWVANVSVHGDVRPDDSQSPDIRQ